MEFALVSAEEILNKCGIKHKYWRLKELEFIRNNIHLTDEQIAAALGRTEGGVNRARQRYNLKKTNDGRFKKGCKAWNKNKHYQPNNYDCRFKKGRVNDNVRATMQWLGTR